MNSNIVFKGAIYTYTYTHTHMYTSVKNIIHIITDPAFPFRILS